MDNEPVKSQQYTEPEQGGEYGAILPRRNQIEGLAEDLAEKLASLFGVDVPKIRGLFELLNETEESFEITFTIRLPKRKG